MDTSHNNHIQAIKKPVVINENHNQQSQKQVTTIISSPSPPTSPSHEFSFTISLHTSNHHSTNTSSSSSSSSSTSIIAKSTAKTNNVTSSSSSFAIDLSPADDIFFHGHLLPLHFLSHLPSSSLSPRSSINSLDSFTLPIDHLPDDTPVPKTTTTSSSSSSSTTPPPPSSSKQNKPNSFSLFNKWRKTTNTTTNEDCDDHIISNNKQPKRNKLRFEVLKRYARMVRPFLLFKGIRKDRNSLNHRRQPYSFSGTLSPRTNSYKDLIKRRPGEYSAPASMRTSPSNSGLLVATTAGTAAASESTIDELQAAIQAAIAHCKNSIANSNDQKTTTTTTATL